MDTDPLLSTMFGSLRASYRLGVKGAPDSRLLELRDVTASIVPAAPDRSVVNAVVYEHPDTLRAVLDDLAQVYEEAGVRAWTVWVSEGDEQTAELLASAGHALDASPRAMGLELDQLADAPGPEPAWSDAWDLRSAGLVNDRAYGDPDGSWARALGALPPGSAHLYLARLNGEPASFVMVHDHEADCVFWFAATVEGARGRGLATGLLHRALRDALERGCRTSTTQATAMGRPVYERVGYRDLGAVHMYERRRT